MNASDDDDDVEDNNNMIEMEEEIPKKSRPIITTKKEKKSSEKSGVVEEKIKKKKEDERGKVMEYMERYNENRMKKEHSLSKLPTTQNGIYDVQLKSNIADAKNLKQRKNMGLEDIFEAKKDTIAISVDENGNPYPKPGTLKKPIPSAAQLREEENKCQSVAEKLQQIGAMHVFSPKMKTYPLHKFLEDHLGPISQENKAKTAPKPTSNITNAQESNDNQAQSTITPTNTLGTNRMNTLVRGKKPAASTMKSKQQQNQPTNVTDQLSDDDPAQITIDRWSVEQACILMWYEARCEYHLKKCKHDPKKQPPPPPYEMPAEHVAWLMTEPHGPFNPCMWGHLCVTYRLSSRHPDGAFVGKMLATPAQRREFEHTGKITDQLAPYCYACDRAWLDFLIDDNVNSVRRADKVYVAYYHIKDRPGEYKGNAMCHSIDGYIDAGTRPLRRFDGDEFEPAYKEVLIKGSGMDGKVYMNLQRVKALREPDYVFCTNSITNKKMEEKDNQNTKYQSNIKATTVNSTAPVQPLEPHTYQVTKIVSPPLTAESILRKNFMNSNTAVKNPLAAHEIELRPIKSSSIPVSKESTKVHLTLSIDEITKQIEDLNRRLKEVTANSSMQPSEKISAMNVIRNQIIEFSEKLKTQTQTDEKMTQPPVKKARFDDGASSSTQKKSRREDLPDASGKSGSGISGDDVAGHSGSGHNASKTPTINAHLNHKPTVSNADKAHKKVPLTASFNLYIDKENLKLPLDDIPQEKTQENRVYDIVFRDFYESYLLLRKWLSESSDMPVQEFARSYELLSAENHLPIDKIPEFSLKTIIVNLLNLRLLVTNSLLKKLSSGDYDRKGQKVSLGVAISERSAQLRRQKTLLPNESIIRKLSYWEKRHENLVAWFKLRNAQNQSLDDEPLLTCSITINLGGEDYELSSSCSALPLVSELFRETEEKVPLSDQDLMSVRYRVLHFKKPTPSQLLFLDYQRDLKTQREMPASIFLKLSSTFATVLCDFRKTVEYLSRPENKNIELPTHHWMPEFNAKILDKSRNLAYYMEYSTISRNEMMKKNIERAKKKAINASGANLITNEEVAEAVIESAENSSQVNALKTKLQDEKNKIHQETNSLMDHTRYFCEQLGPRKNQRLKHIIAGRNWWAPNIGNDKSYLILAALVYRVNNATDFMEYERASLEGLEKKLKYLKEKEKQMEEKNKKETAENNDQPDRMKYNDTTADAAEEANNDEAEDDDDDDDGYYAFQKRLNQLRKNWRSEERANPKSNLELILNAAIEEQLDRIHLWKRFIYSHLDLACAIMNPALSDESDDVLLQGRFRGVGVSIYQLNYPYDEISFCEEMLQRVNHKVSSVDLIGNSDTERNPSDWFDLLKKLFPRAGSDRELSSKLDEICKRNPEIYRYTVECWRASLCSAYRHSRIVTKFELAIEIHRACKLALTLPQGRRIMLDTILSNEEIILHAMQENISRQYCQDYNIQTLNVQWVHGCMDIVRALFNTNRCIDGINTHILTAYRKQDFGKQGIYRVTHNNFLKFIYGIFRNIEIARILSAIMTEGKNSKHFDLKTSSASPPEKPKTMVYRLSKCVVEAMLHYIEAIRPGSKITLKWFKDIGISDDGISKLLQINDKFIRREPTLEITRLVKDLGRMDYELMALFFYMLRRHYSARLIPLDENFALAQEEAIRKRNMVPIGETIPEHLLHGFNCSILGCNELKSFVVQEIGTTEWYGNERTVWDEARQKLFCASKKTILGKGRNEEKVDEFIDTEPEWIVKARLPNWQDYFYGGMEDFDGILASASQIQSYRTDRHKTQEKLKVFIDYVSSTKLCSNREEAINLVLEKPSQELLNSMNPTEADLLLNIIKELERSGKKLSKRVWKLKYRWPCYELPVTEVLLRGYVYEKDKIKEKEASHGVTICPSCGAITRFSIDMYGTNGFHCICDKNEPMILTLPRCVFCNNHNKTMRTNGDLKDVKYSKLKSLYIFDDGPDGKRTKTKVSVCGKCWRHWMIQGSKVMTKLEFIHCLNDPYLTQDIRPFLMDVSIIKPLVTSSSTSTIIRTYLYNLNQEKDNDKKSKHLAAPKENISIKDYQAICEKNKSRKRRFLG